MRTDVIRKLPHPVEMWRECRDLAILLGLEAAADEGLDQVNRKSAAVNDERALEEFFEESSRLCGASSTCATESAASCPTASSSCAVRAAGKVTLGASRKGMNLARGFSRPVTLLAAQRATGAA